MDAGAEEGYMLVMDGRGRDTVVIGFGKDGCDPKNYTVLKADDGKEGCLWAPERSARWAMAMDNLPQLFEKAKGAWAINPRNPAPTKATKAKAAPAEPSAGHLATATVTEAPTEAPTEELPLLSEEERMTTETTPPVDDPEGAQAAQETPEGAQDAQEAPVAPEETPEAPDGLEAPGTWPGGYEAQAPGDPEAQEAVGGTLGPPTMTGGYGAQRDPSGKRWRNQPGEADPPATEPGDPPATEAAPPAAPAAGNGGSWRYYVKDGAAEAGFDTVHAALLALGVTQKEIDGHKYWHRYDRLPKAHADAIRRERVG